MQLHPGTITETMLLYHSFGTAQKEKEALMHLQNQTALTLTLPGQVATTEAQNEPLELIFAVVFKVWGLYVNDVI